MREDVVKFQKLATGLLEEGLLKKDEIVKVMSISLPTLDKLLNEHPDLIKIRSSVLGAVQDFNKVYRDYVPTTDKFHEPPFPDKVNKKDMDEVIHAAKEMLEDSPPSCADKTIWSMLRDLEKALPKNMSIQLIINSRK